MRCARVRRTDVTETDSLRRSVCTLVGVMLLLPAWGQTQRRPDFSGEWELVEALASGARRDGAASEGPRRTTSTTISGAAFNCGRGCTIVHKGPKLTIRDAQLAGDVGKARPTPPVTLNLDGRPMKVVDSFNPSRELSVTVRWDGNKVRIDKADPGIAITQRLSLEDGQFVVVTSTMLHGEPRGDVTYRYRRR
jgi:hypothetical protein